METQKRCEHCNASLRIWTHRLTPGLVETLSKFARAVKAAGKNDLNNREIGLTTNEVCNFQKLRYFALVAKVKDKSGMHTPGHWLLTRKGAQFLRGDIKVPREISTFRNRIEERSPELVIVWDIKGQEGTAEYFQKEFPYMVHEQKTV